MNADAARFDDPKRTPNVLLLGNCQNLLQTVQQSARACPGTKVQDNHASALIWRETQHLAEIAVKGYENTAFRRANLEDSLIGRTRKPLIANRRDIVSPLRQQLAATRANVLVELDLHAAGFTLTGTIRSRAISAA